ncbi:MAG: MFS transporter, partial [Treponema sp.]|nr:MFS transporter [Treponema sp.]
MSDESSAVEGLEISPCIEDKLSFRLIVISQGISMIGGAVLRFAISLHVLDLTGSAEIFATMIALSFLTMIFFQPVGGAFADRFSKKAIFVISDGANTLLAGALAVLLFGGLQSALVLGAVTVLLTLVSVFYHPTVAASMPAILKPENLSKANGAVQGVRAVSITAGPVMAGFLFGALGVNRLVALCAAIFLVSAILNIFIKVPYKPQK